MGKRGRFGKYKGVGRQVLRKKKSRNEKTRGDRKKVEGEIESKDRGI